MLIFRHYPESTSLFLYFEKVSTNSIKNRPMKYYYNFAVLGWLLMTILAFSSCHPQHSSAAKEEAIPPIETIVSPSFLTDIDSIKNAFFEAFNHGAIEDFMAYFDEAMRARNSEKELRQNFTSLAQQIGLIRSIQLDKREGNHFSFRSLHEKLISLQVVFELNEAGALTGLQFNSEFPDDESAPLERNVSDLILPFHDEWYVFWGGKKASDNYHNSYTSMKGAFDFWVMGSNGLSHRAGAQVNEDFYAFGKEIIAPVAGKVIYAFDKVKDNNWPAMNAAAGFGNVVLLETDKKEYLVFAHLQHGSVSLEEGQWVKQGDRLGLCGNSGNSTEPHLHFQLQQSPNFNSATGAWIYFRDILVNGKNRGDYIPMKGDKIKNP